MRGNGVAAWGRQLDGWEAQLRREPAPACVDEIFRGLEEGRRALEDDAWREVVERVVQPHPLVSLLHECPYTQRAWAKPCGYAGDAALLDFLYFGLRPDYVHDRAVTPRGRIVFRRTVGCGAGEAVRERRLRIAEAVDEAGQARGRARVLSVASGYLREAALAKALATGQIERWTCIDQDAASVRGILPLTERFPEIEPIRGSIRQLLVDQLDAGSDYDLAYAAGLLDYLDADVARLLVAKLFARLAPGGRLLVANFAAGTPERGFMEAVADWWLLYRTGADMLSLADGIPPAALASLDVYPDDTGRMLYLDLRRA